MEKALRLKKRDHDPNLGPTLIECEDVIRDYAPAFFIRIDAQCYRHTHAEYEKQFVLNPFSPCFPQGAQSFGFIRSLQTVHLWKTLRSAILSEVLSLAKLTK